MAAPAMGTEARAPMIKDEKPGTPPLVIFDRLLIFLSFFFWLAVDFLGIYAIIVQTSADSGLEGEHFWKTLHNFATGLLLVILSLLGVYWEIRSLQVGGWLSVSEEALQFLIYIVCGCYMAAGPWSTTHDQESEATSALGHVLTILGMLLAVGRVTVGCLKRQERARAARCPTAPPSTQSSRTGAPSTQSSRPLTVD